MKKIRKNEAPFNAPLILGLSGVLLLTFICYRPSLDNGFLSWDDDVYVVNNPLLRNFSFAGLQEIFSGFLWGNYHPLTVLSLLIDYQIGGLNPYGYHLVNILLHLLNTGLIAFIVFRLTQKKTVPALLAALCFGLHPLHVESVTWISERKDVLYTAFLLFAWITYDKYRDTKHNKYFYYTILLFIASCLSKGMAVIFPLLLLAGDYLRYGKLTQQDIVSKWPFWLLSLFFGILAIAAQQSVGAIREDAGYSVLDNIIVAFYGLLWYLYKMLIPLNLSAFYPYPIKAAGDFLPFMFYLAPPVVIAISIASYKYRKVFPELSFGWIWYIASMLMVVKLVPLSEAMTADRYFYLSSVGLFISLALFVNRFIKYSSLIYLPAALALAWGYLTYEQTQIWKNDLTLFGDMIKKFPNLSLAYNNRGKFYYQQGKKEEAIQDFLRSAELDPDNESAQNNVGYILMENNKVPEAINYFKRAVEIHPEFADGYFNLGNAYARQHAYVAAIEAYTLSISIQSENPGVWNNLGNVYKESNIPDSALHAYEQSLKLNPRGKSAMTGMGELYEQAADTTKALEWYKKAAEIHTQDTDLMNRIGVLYAKLTQYSQAIDWFKKASEINDKEAATWQNLAMAYERTGQIPDAVQAYQQAARLGSKGAQDILTKNGVAW